MRIESSLDSELGQNEGDLWELLSGHVELGENIVLVEYWNPKRGDQLEQAAGRLSGEQQTLEAESFDFPLE